MIICAGRWISALYKENSVAGDRNLGLFTNFCATTANEPNPASSGVRWHNNSGVWFTFTTSSNPGSIIEIVALADPNQLGNDLNIQLALYTSRTDCSAAYDFELEHWNENDFDEYMLLTCPEPNRQYYILVDGVITYPEQLDGYFSMEVRDHGVSTTPDFPCDAQDLGSLQSQDRLEANMASNICADNFLDPRPAAFPPRHGVWFSFIAPDSRNVSITVQSDQAYPVGLDNIDPALALFGGDCDQLVEITSQNEVQGTGAETMEVQCLTPGERYWLMVDGAGFNRNGVFDVAINTLDPTFSSEEIDFTFCEGDSLLIGNEFVSQAGPYSIQLLTADGCDSLVFGEIELIPPVTSTLDTTICAGK